MVKSADSVRNRLLPCRPRGDGEERVRRAPGQREARFGRFSSRLPGDDLEELASLPEETSPNRNDGSEHEAVGGEDDEVWSSRCIKTT